VGISPQSASAQTGEEGTEPTVVEPAPSSEPAPEEPALQLKLDPAGVDVAPSPPRTADGYTLEGMDVRVKRARIGFGVSGGVYGAGAVLAVVAGSVGLAQGFGPPEDQSADRFDRAVIAGVVLAGGGVVGMITAGGIWGHRKRQRRELVWDASDSRTLHRVQWDLAQSRLVF